MHASPWKVPFIDDYIKCCLGQIYLPPYSDCSVSFMQQIMCGKKKVSIILFHDLGVVALCEPWDQGCEGSLLGRVISYTHLPDCNHQATVQSLLAWLWSREAHQQNIPFQRKIEFLVNIPPLDHQHSRPYFLPEEHPWSLPYAYGGTSSAWKQDGWCVAKVLRTCHSVEHDWQR